MNSSFRYYTAFKSLLLFCKSVVYRGSRFICPVCDFRAAALLPSPDGLRKNARCPRCDSLERHRAQWLFGIKKMTSEAPKRLSVLHFAPEHCFAVKLSQSRQIIYHTAGYTKNRLTDHTIDLMNIPLAESSFDAVICNHILEHVPDDHAALKELYRILKPGGTAFIQVPLDMSCDVTLEDPEVVTPEDRKRVFGQEDHVRLYGRDFAGRCEKAGFTVECIEFWNAMPEQEFKKYALLEGEPIFIAHK